MQMWPEHFYEPVWQKIIGYGQTVIYAPADGPDKANAILRWAASRSGEGSALISTGLPNIMF